LPQNQHSVIERTRAECEEKQSLERAAYIQAGMETAEHIRRLEHANYTLRVQLEQMAPSSMHAPGMPRWGEGY
jgi:hypothetical protein